MQTIYIATESHYESSPYVFDTLSVAMEYVLSRILSSRDVADVQDKIRVSALVTYADFVKAGAMTAAEYSKNPQQWFFIGNWQIKSAPVRTTTDRTEE